MFALFVDEGGSSQSYDSFYLSYYSLRLCTMSTFYVCSLHMHRIQFSRKLAPSVRRRGSTGPIAVRGDSLDGSLKFGQESVGVGTSSGSELNFGAMTPSSIM